MVVIVVETESLLCILGRPGTHRYSSASISQVLGYKVSITTHGLMVHFILIQVNEISRGTESCWSLEESIIRMEVKLHLL